MLSGVLRVLMGVSFLGGFWLDLGGRALWMKLDGWGSRERGLELQGYSHPTPPIPGSAVLTGSRYWFPLAHPMGGSRSTQCRP